MIVVANKSDLVAGEGYMTMSTQTGDGIDAVLAEILAHKPEPVEKKRTVTDIRSPIIHEPEESEMDDDSDSSEKVKKPKKKRLHRKPRTDRAGINPETV
jgi:hypothetical protein